jgi:hypothetical protein
VGRVGRGDLGVMVGRIWLLHGIILVLKLCGDKECFKRECFASESNLDHVHGVNSPLNQNRSSANRNETE